MTAATATWMAGLVEAVKAPERLSVSQWAEKHLILSERSTSFPGRFRVDRAPYCREWLDCIVDSSIEEITICTAAQVAKTMTQMAILGYVIDQDPGPALLVLPNADLAKSFSEQRLQPLIDDCPALARHKPLDSKKYRLQEIFFDRMQLAIVGSNSPANLASRPVRYLFLDEVDKYPQATDREAGAVDLAVKRTRTFWNRKIIKTSTPTLTTGEIWRSWLGGDMRRYHVPCPHCDAYQVLTMQGIQWSPSAKRKDGTYDAEAVRKSAAYFCRECGEEITDREKRGMLARGEWRAEGQNSRRRSYHLSAIYAPWVSFGDIAVQWVESQPYTDKFRDFVNSTLGEPWEERIESVNEDGVLAHCAEYKQGTCPVEPLAVIITADVQQDSCYYVVRAWGSHESSYLIQYGVLPSLQALEALGKSTFNGPTGPLHPTHAFIDSGYRTDEVYRFCEANRWVPVKGASGLNQPLRLSGIANLSLLHVDADYFKDALMLRLRVNLGDPGAWFLPAETGLDYARQIVAEGKVEVTDKWGRVKTKWKQTDMANHYLDCETYQVAAMTLIGVRHMEPDQRRATEGLRRRDGRDWCDR